VGLTSPFETQQVLATPAMVVTGSPSCLKGNGAPPKKARTKNYLPPSTRYVCVGHCMLICVTHQP
jgi:hypothetical protein